MNTTTEDLFKAIETGSIEEKRGALLVLGDDIEFAHFKPEIIIEIVERIINVLTTETDWSVIKLLFRNINIALTLTIDLSPINYEPLINMLDRSTPIFINHVLYLLSMTYNKKYIPVISKYLDHPDNTVKQEAEDAIRFMNG